MTRAVMLQGTGSDVGKSLIAAGLCRLYANRGLRVVPFKPQNMSNNAAATADGGEIGRAQALQALAARAEPTVDMNPILLKPEADGGAQIILQGRRVATLSARDYFAARRRYEPAILDSYRRLAASADLIIVEGAGSPAEINLREGDLANMGFAQAADLPVVLIGDVHRGGVIASLVGTFAVLGEADRQRIRAVLINNFHGDPTLFADALTLIETRTGCPSLGVIPHFPGARDLPAEDSMTLERSRPVRDGPFNVAVLRLPRIANFDDLDPLRMEPSVAVTFVEAGSPIPPASALVILPGSKTTIADLQHLRAEGWDIDIKAHVRRGGHVLGLCGGYQMLGTRIHDPHGLEGPVQSVDGLGLLDVETTLEPGKSVKQTRAVHCVTGAPMAGYEIHLGHTRGQDCQRPFARIDNTSDGATSRDGRVAGTYLHGCFTGDDFRRAYLASLGVSLSGALAYAERIDATLDALAAHLERHMDVNRLLAIAAPVDQG